MARRRTARLVAVVDTPVVTGEAAVFRGRLLKGLAIACGMAGGTLGFLLWRLASLLRVQPG